MTARPPAHPRRIGPRFAFGLLAMAIAGGVAATGSAGATASKPPVIVGTWRPVSVAGFTGTLTSPPLAVAPRFHFDAKGKVSGSDGCNYVSGSYRFGRDGTVKFQVGQTKRLCAVPNPPSPLPSTVRVKVRNSRLVFLASGGRELATYARGKATTTPTRS